MSYVLTVIHPPANGAAYGKATPLPGTGAVWTTARAAGSVLHHGCSVNEDATADFVADLESAPVGTPRTHTETGLTFRIDPADSAPHPCPCGEDEPDGCGRLVLPGDHAFADMADAVCTGCWGDTVTSGCLPANTAHPAEESS